MDGLLQLRGAEHVADRGLRERSVRRESQSERIDLPPQRSQTHEGVFCPRYLLGEQDVRGPVAGEIGRVHAEAALLRRLVHVVQPEIAGYQVGPAVTVEVPCGQAVPPAAQRRQVRSLCDIAEALSTVAI